MAEQRVFFEQGGPETGDSDERLDPLAIKPTEDGQRAVEENFNRPLENIRQRTEILRDVAEEFLYKNDAVMRWAITGGDSTGAAASVPSVGHWDSSTGIFTITEDIVIQPLNTPDTDIFASLRYDFTGPSPDYYTCYYTFESLKRAYDGANLLRIIWVAADGDSTEAGDWTEPGYCDIATSGNPEHTVTITIRDDDATQHIHIVSAITDTVVAAALLAMGISISYGGTNNTPIDYDSISSDARDCLLEGTFERELHFITTTVFNDYVSLNPLSDGDSLAIWFNYYNTPDPDTDGRRQCINANGNTAVMSGNPGRLFVTSENPERIPNCIPICKRVGDQLYFVDGTVLTSSQLATDIEFGEHGKTVDRIVNTPAAIFAMDATITGHWRHDSPFSFNAPVPADPAMFLGYADPSLSDSVSYHFVTGTISEVPTGGSARSLDGYKTAFVINYPEVSDVSSVYGFDSQINFVAGNADSDIAAVNGTFLITGSSIPNFASGSDCYAVHGTTYISSNPGGVFAGGILTGVGAKIELVGAPPNTESSALDVRVLAVGSSHTHDLSGANIDVEVHGTFADGVNLYGTNLVIEQTSGMGTTAGGNIIGYRTANEALVGNFHNGNLIGNDVAFSLSPGITGDLNVYGARSVIATAGGEALGAVYGLYNNIDFNATTTQSSSVVGSYNLLDLKAISGSGLTAGGYFRVNADAATRTSRLYGVYSQLSVDAPTNNAGGHVYHGVADLESVNAAASQYTVYSADLSLAISTGLVSTQQLLGSDTSLAITSTGGTYSSNLFGHRTDITLGTSLTHTLGTWGNQTHISADNAVLEGRVFGKELEIDLDGADTSSLSSVVGTYTILKLDGTSPGGSTLIKSVEHSVSGADAVAQYSHYSSSSKTNYIVMRRSGAAYPTIAAPFDGAELGGLRWDTAISAVAYATSAQIQVNHSSLSGSIPVTDMFLQATGANALQTPSIRIDGRNGTVINKGGWAGSLFRTTSDYTTPIDPTGRYTMVFTTLQTTTSISFADGVTTGQVLVVVNTTGDPLTITDIVYATGTTRVLADNESTILVWDPVPGSWYAVV